jgi:hypothetical protein
MIHENRNHPNCARNVLRRLVFISPLIRITGLRYLFYADWTTWGLTSLQLERIATGHTIGAFLMLDFLSTQLYM